MFHGEHARYVPRGTEPIDTKSPTPEEELESARSTIAQGLRALKLDRDLELAPHFDPQPKVLDQLARLAILLAAWAPRMNLTGHRGADEIARRLILDALAMIRVLPDFENLADLGSGAGFPGLPIAILFPDRAVVSVEARSRRVSFQRTALRELGVENVTVILGRIESLEPLVSDAVVAQAVGPSAKVADWMLPWCEDAGWMAIPGSEQSLGSSQPPPNPILADVEVRTYRVPLKGADRRVWLARKKPASPR